MCMGNSLMPQEALITSRMQKHLCDLKISHIIEGNNCVREVLNMRPYIPVIPSGLSYMLIASLSDAIHGGTKYIYGQTGGICGLLVESCDVKDRISHLISCLSHKTWLVSCSDFGTDILAASDAEDCGYDLKMTLKSLIPS